VAEAWREEWNSESRWMVHGGRGDGGGGRFYKCCRMGKDRKPIPNQWVQAWYVPGEGTFPWDRSNATLVWNRWEVVRGHRAAVFDYSVSQHDSHWIKPYFDNATIPHAGGVLWSGPVTNLRKSAILPYKGSVWVDPFTGAIWRHSVVINEIPARFVHRSESDITDFDLVTLGETQYLLRVMDVFVMDNVNTDREEWVYSNYGKFEADSSITFFEADSTVTYRH
jgi:hypothetical protein